jgi:hypothetical protein
LAIDATQAAGVISIDVAVLRPAFVACSVHKWLLGPYGVSLLYVGPSLRGGRPLEAHERALVGSDNPLWDELGAMSELGYPTVLRTDASRFDSGGKSHLEISKERSPKSDFVANAPRFIAACCSMVATPGGKVLPAPVCAPCWFVTGDLVDLIPSVCACPWLLCTPPASSTYCGHLSPVRLQRICEGNCRLLAQARSDRLHPKWCN